MTNLSELVSATGITVSSFDYQRYVDRGDPAAWDFEVGDLTTDATWRDLDLSSIVPSNAVAVVLRVQVKDGTINQYIAFRKNGNSNTYTSNVVRAQVAGQYNDALLIIPCDTSQIIEYQASNTTFTAININVLGWYVESEEAAVGSGNVLAGQTLTDQYLTRGDGGTDIDVSTVKVTDNGEMTNPSQPSFQAQIASSQSNVTGDDTSYSITGAIWTEVEDQGNNFSNGTFTAPVTGRYHFDCNLRLGALSSGHTRLLFGLYTSNRYYYNIEVNPYACSISGALRLNFSCDADMDASDTAYLIAIVYNSTKTVSVVSGYTKFAGHLIC